MSRDERNPEARPDHTAIAILLGMGIGAALMYFLDPEQGRRRRALVVDRSTHYARGARDAQERLTRDAANRVRGALANIRQLVEPEEAVDDGILIERVRAALGHVIADVHAIDVRAHEGRVVLKGPVRQEEVGEIVACAERVRGVKSVDNRLSVSNPATASSTPSARGNGAAAP